MTATLTEIRPREREKELWRRLRRDRDQRAREELVSIYIPMARRMAGRYAGVVEPYDDLVQVASLGLLNAIDRFDLDRGTPFIGFAKPTIMGELKRYFRDKVWTIRVPRSMHDRMAAIESATEELIEELYGIRPREADRRGADGWSYRLIGAHVRDNEEMVLSYLERILTSRREPRLEAIDAERVHHLAHGLREIAGVVRRRGRFGGGAEARQVQRVHPVGA